MMTQPPELFGRVTAILSDHKNLRQTIGRLRQMCALLEQRPPTLAPEFEPSGLLEGLHEDLVAHFAAEESEGYFGTVEAERPALAAQISELKSQHAVFLKELGNLREMAQTTERWLELSAGTRSLVEQLESHERAESQLLHGFLLC
ncbi:MAG TPA: hemerythrin domain-containing protein [Polyangiaceae bacterium]|nr:hemerythrin domain-containing protein [Polyangiaceae bacterium]